MVDPRLFQALSDATRLEILSVLAAGPINVSRIVAQVGCAQPAVSRHLRVLREASLINDKRKGKEVEYSINHDMLLAAVDHLTSLAGRSADQEISAGRASRIESDAKRAAAVASAPAKRARSGARTIPVKPKKAGRAQRAKARRGSAESKRRESEQAAAADFVPREAGYTVERKPSGIDDFLL